MLTGVVAEGKAYVVESRFLDSHDDVLGMIRTSLVRVPSEIGPTLDESLGNFSPLLLSSFISSLKINSPV